MKRSSPLLLLVLILACRGGWDVSREIVWQRTLEFGEAPVELLLRLDCDSVTVDETVHAELILSAGGAIRASLPDPRSIPLQMLVLRHVQTAPPEPIEKGGHRERLLLTLEPTLPGEAGIGPLEVSYEVKSDETWVEHSLLVDKASLTVLTLGVPSEGPVEFKPPRGAAWPKESYVLPVAIAVAVLGLVFCAMYWFFLRRARRIVPPVPPHRTALRALVDLERRELLERGELMRYYVELSTVVRRYIEQAFGIPALEQTTEEFVSNVQRTQTFDSEQKNSACDLLGEADLVKFAKHDPGRERAKEKLYVAKEFIRSSAPAEEEPDGV